MASPFNSSGAFSDDPKTGKLTRLVQHESMAGRFRTPSLRNAAMTAPYMHAGQLATLEEVVRFYSLGGGSVIATGYVKDPKIVKLELTDQQQADLVELMKSMTGEPVAASALVDTSK